MSAKVRWIVRREPYRTPRFGETRRDVTVWAVRMRLVDVGRVIEGAPTYFAGLTAAITHARTECEAYYGRP